MYDERFDAPDASRSRLRAIVAEIGRGIAVLPPASAGGDGEPQTRGLAASWTDLVEHLALGPQPDVRTCPICKNIGMRAATRCGYCWVKLSPLAVVSAATGEGAACS